MHMAYVAPHADGVLAATKEMRHTTAPKLLHGLFDGFKSTADFPCCLFNDNLMDMYLDAKIVLNTRPGGGVQWARSMRQLAWA